MNEFTRSRGAGGCFARLLRTHPAIEHRLAMFMHSLSPEAVINRKILLLKFVQLCKEEGLTDEDYPLCTRSRGERALIRWVTRTCMPARAMARVKPSNGVHS